MGSAFVAADAWGFGGMFRLRRPADGKHDELLKALLDDAG